ncbi:MAG TPA: RagB/SusD family nutrient uptake outer membrane protein [Anseongella sp.]|nr:RagB/SusD family nutrient uptake outer membrane protein [Anseongella sp.]
MKSYLFRSGEEALLAKQARIRWCCPGEAGEGAEFFNWLLLERSFELGFEGKEWFAAVRIGRREGYRDVLIELAANFHSMNVSYPVTRARLLNQESWFLPYHLTEVENNTQLEQKEFYRNK